MLICVHYKNDWIPDMETPEGSITSADVRSAFKIIPTLMAINIGFNVGYNGMDIYQLQACQMDVRAPDVEWLRDILLIPKYPGQLNGNFYSLGNNLSIILMIPLFEALCHVQRIGHWTTRHPFVRLMSIVTTPPSTTVRSLDARI